jgi:UDP-glucose 4-epimerase
MKYLVTGGCGFIGSHLCDALVKQGHSVRILDDLSTGTTNYLPDSVELVIGNVVDPDTVKKAIKGMDGCFHLAAVASVERSMNDWVGAHKVNQQASVNLFDASRSMSINSTVPIVFASSAAIYGDNASLPLGESTAARPISAYGADKLGSEHHARVAWLSHGVSTVGLRFFNVYGPRQNPDSPYSGVISIFVDRVLRGLPLIIHGKGDQTRDFIYVSDVVNYLMRAMDNQSGESSVYNVCTGQSTSISQLAKTLSIVSGSQPNITYKSARSGDIASSLGDPSRVIKRYGIQPQVELGEGLKLILQSIKDAHQLPIYNPIPKSA